MAPARVQSVVRRKKLNKSLSSTLEKRAPGGACAALQVENFASGVSPKCSRAFLAYETDELVLIPCQHFRARNNAAVPVSPAAPGRLPDYPRPKSWFVPRATHAPGCGSVIATTATPNQ